MSAKDFVKAFYKSDALIDSTILKDFIHPEISIDWNSTEGFVQLNYQGLINLADQLHKAYVRSKVRISHIVEENEMIAVRYSHFVKTIENPREEILLAHFMTIWEIKDNKLFRGYQMSQLS
ncbi:nuclear transport factor 2 family protein [Flavobacterium sp.]|uniref:nuclear transport factor 2 family protein n=1 Tax=Flavobacterium sp. TaxID=239 RepID=UPI0022C99182|nr:nuclear transport factor 2 family protein [Flavobacterium sp.]MCZ8228439.1 nuclear transport factor 2 family protein [Flavobacterium sp.]